MVAVFIILGVLLALLTVQAICVRRDRRRFPPPGQIVNGLHILKQGQGVPSVVFESGLANSSLAWSLIQPKVASFATAYSYDRAGIGWSDVSHAPCCLNKITVDLREVLQQQEVPRPFVLVGHSFGGLIARYYAQHFPQELSGLVLVDPATPEEWMAPTVRQRFRLRRAIFFTRAAGVLASIGAVRLGLWLLLRRKQDIPGPVSRFSSTLRRIRFELRKIPADVLPRVCAHWGRPGFYWTMAAYLKALPSCAAECAGSPFPANLPVVVLSGAHQPPERLAEHAAMATTHIIAKGSGHFIHLDEPELVVKAVREVLKTENQKITTERSHSVAEPQLKPKTHHGDTESRSHTEKN